jgi:hypothetical protein
VIARLADDHEIVFVTGRPGRLRDETVAWLEAFGLDKHRLVMRPQGDRRPAAQVKRELVAALARGRDIGIVVDDDAFVLDALPDAGYPTFAADWEKRRAEDESTLLEAQEVSGQT